MRIPYTQDPMTGDLNSNKHHTEAHISAVRYHDTPVEHTLVFNRSTGEEVDLGVSHFGSHHEVTLTVFNTEQGEPTTIHEEVTISYQEARMLRALLNRPEVALYLEQDYH